MICALMACHIITDPVDPSFLLKRRLKGTEGHVLRAVGARLSRLVPTRASARVSNLIFAAYYTSNMSGDGM